RTAEVGIPFHSPLVATGGRAPYTWSVTGAPDWLRVGSDGAVSGVPKRVGASTLNVHLVDAVGSAKDLPLRLVVRARLAIATKTLPAAAAGHAYRSRVAVR